VQENGKSRSLKPSVDPNHDRWSSFTSHFVVVPRPLVCVRSAETLTPKWRVTNGYLQWSPDHSALESIKRLIANLVARKSLFH
jgi:hypothetical protein